MSERMTYGEVLRLTEGHGTSELWERWQEMTTRLAAAEEQQDIAAWNWGKCESELAAARRALDTAREDARQGWASMHAVEQTAADAIMERDAARRALEEIREQGVYCQHCGGRALLAPERPREERR